MKSTDDVTQALRRRAEETLREPRSRPEPESTDLQALIYELQVHQVELEMQNEALQESQRALEASNARYRELYDLAPVAYLSLDEQSKIVRANRAAGALLALDPQRLVGKPLSRYVAESHAELFERHRRELNMLERRCSCSLELVTASGKPREVRIDSVLVPDRDAPWRCTLHDVTELNRLQRSLQQAQKLESMNTLASGVAHEFNNILTGVLGCSDLALSRIEPDAPAGEAVAEIRRAALRGRSVVTQLLAFAHRGAEPVETVDVHASIRAAEPMVRQVLGEGVALELQLDATQPYVRGGQLEPILLNLATNARHAMPHGGILRIETANVAPNALSRTVRAEIGELACVVVSVRDTGHGMDARTAARAFDPFFTTKPAGTGTGLGLPMVYGAMRQAGGHVELSSEPGRGATLTLYWPQIDAQPSQPTSGSPVAIAQAVHALVVDRDSLVRRTLSYYLGRSDGKVSEAATGAEALATLRARHTEIDVLIVDANVSDMTPMHLIAEARVLQPELALMLMSAHAKEWLVARGTIDPAVPMLQKPFTVEEFDEALLDALAVQMWEREG